MNPDVAITELCDLVNSAASEHPVQTHLERHPWLVTGSHAIDPNLVISKLPLGPDYIPDFAYFWRESGGQYLQLVEIEAPRLRAFTQDDEFTADFNHAVQQLADWENWCARHPHNIGELMEPLFDAGVVSALPTFTRVKTILIAGRREDVLANRRRRERWEHKVNEVGGRRLRTWDGFIESLPRAYYASFKGWQHMQCVRYREREFQQIEVGRE